MTFLEAKAKLNKIADGTYCRLQYSLTTDSYGKEHPTCQVYVQGHYNVMEDGPTWETAFIKLARGMHKQEEINLEEAPE